jgi:hypothetical protein
MHLCISAVQSTHELGDDSAILRDIRLNEPPRPEGILSLQDTNARQPIGIASMRSPDAVSAFRAGGLPHRSDCALPQAQQPPHISLIVQSLSAKRFLNHGYPHHASPPCPGPAPDPLPGPP